MYNSKLLEEKFIKKSNNNFTLLKDNLFFSKYNFSKFSNFKNDIILGKRQKLE